MKKTIDLPDQLHRQAKAEAARSGRKLKDMVEEGVRRVPHDRLQSEKAAQQPTLADLMEEFCGIFDSGIDDLATNPKYMADYGRSRNDV